MLFAFIFLFAGMIGAKSGYYALVSLFFVFLVLRTLKLPDMALISLFGLAGWIHYKTFVKGIPAERTSYAISGKFRVAGTKVLKPVELYSGVPFKLRSVFMPSAQGLTRGEILGITGRIKRDTITNDRWILSASKVKVISEKVNLIDRMREYLVSRIEGLSFNKESRGLLMALFVGDRSFLGKNTINDFKSTGTMHILALSGLHVGIIMLFFVFLFSLFGFNRRVTLIFSIVLLPLYIFIVGVRPPILRAYILFAMIALSFVIKRKPNSLNALGTAGFLSLVIFPSWVNSVSFQLSYLSIFGIIYYSKQFHLDIKNKIAYYLISLFLVSIYATLFTFPILVRYFKYFSIEGPLVNLFIIPYLTVFMWLVLIVLIFSVILPFLTPLFAFVVSVFSGIFLKIVSLFAGLIPVIRVRSISNEAIVLYLFLLLILPLVLKAPVNAMVKKKHSAEA